MAVASKASGKKAKSALRRSQLPSKRSINLAVAGEKKKHMGLALPGILLIVIVAALLSKFFVIDRLAEVAEAQARVAVLQNRLDADYRELADYNDIAELYAHYTYSGMTAEELQRTDRAEILALLRRVVVPRAVVDSWSLTGNVMSVSLVVDDLNEVNQLVRLLEEEEMVEFCSVTSAVSQYRVLTSAEIEAGLTEYSNVTASLMVYFKSEVEVWG